MRHNGHNQEHSNDHQYQDHNWHPEHTTVEYHTEYHPYWEQSDCHYQESDCHYQENDCHYQDSCYQEEHCESYDHCEPTFHDFAHA
jgi:hypothetical protein